MAENFGNGVGEKNSQPLVQEHILEGDLPNRNDLHIQNLSAQVWKGEIQDSLTKMKQMEKQAEGQKIVEEMPGASATGFSGETYRLLSGDMRGLVAPQDSQKRVEISDCGFGEGLERTQRQIEIQEIQESRRRIRQMDLKPYMWNTTDIRA